MKDVQFEKKTCALCMWNDVCNNKNSKSCVHYTAVDDDGFVVATLEEYRLISHELHLAYLEEMEVSRELEEDDE